MSRKIDFAQPSQWSRFELECLKRIEEINQRAGGRRHADSNETALPQKDEVLYDSFETVAQNIVSLYRIKGWREFQTAAASATTMYKASLEAIRRAAEQARINGKQQAIKELLGALVSTPMVYTNCRSTALLRRDDILALLAGLNNTQPRRHHSRHRGRSMTPEVLTTSSPPPSNRTSSILTHNAPATNDSMRMFHEALVTIPNSPSSRRNDLGSFLVDQVHRYARKRKLTGNSDYQTTASPNLSPASQHQPMDSSPPPASKRTKH